MLNGLWLGFFGMAALAALGRWLIGGDPTVFAALVESLFAMARLAVEVMVLLFGTLTLWLGFLRIAEAAGLVGWLARLLGPLFRRLMPGVPAGHPALGLITMNFAANALGLDNAATPIGLKAMRELQRLNPDPVTATNAQILFLVLNASSLTLLPVTIFMYRAQQGAHDPTMVFLAAGAIRRVKVYECFIEGAKEGFDIAKNLLPYLVAMLCAVGVLRASGALDFVLDGLRWLVHAGGWDARFVDAMPTALVKPFSGSAARAMLIETMKSQGVDSFPALVAATIQGSTETTFYVLAVYFGAVGIQRTRHTVSCALLAELAGVVAAIAVCYWFFG